MFGLGLTPRLLQRAYFSPSNLDLKAKSAPSLAPGVFLAAGLVATEAANLILGRRALKPAPCYLQFDPFMRRFTAGRLWQGNQNPIQRMKKRLIFLQYPQLKRQCRES